MLFANPLVERTVGRKVQVGTTIDRLFLELENGQPVSTLLRSAARWSAWSASIRATASAARRPVTSTAASTAWLSACAGSAGTTTAGAVTAAAGKAFAKTS